MSTIVGRTRSGKEYTPEFAVALDGRKCIGCGRCFKVCNRDVLDLVQRGEDDEIDDDFDEDDVDNMQVMTLADPGDCIGCGACGRVCPKGCYTFAAAAL